jgi:hypothetical protein
LLLFIEEEEVLFAAIGPSLLALLRLLAELDKEEVG